VATTSTRICDVRYFSVRRARRGKKYWTKLLCFQRTPPVGVLQPRDQYGAAYTAVVIRNTQLGSKLRLSGKP